MCSCNIGVPAQGGAGFTPVMSFLEKMKAQVQCMYVRSKAVSVEHQKYILSHINC